MLLASLRETRKEEEERARQSDPTPIFSNSVPKGCAVAGLKDVTVRYNGVFSERHSVAVSRSVLFDP